MKRDFILLLVSILFLFSIGFISAWEDVSGASYDSVSFNVSGQETTPLAIFFKTDGTRMFITGQSGGVYQYTLSTAWDLSTASYDNISFDITNQETSPHNLFFNASGNKMYIIGSDSDAVFQYSLSTAWNISTAVYDNVSFSVANQANVSTGIFFKDDGTKMYITSQLPDPDRVFQYTLSSPWNISTAVYDNVSFNLGGSSANVALFFRSDGGTFYTIDAFSPTPVYQYSLSTAWNISTASLVTSFNPQDSARGLSFNSDGTKMYTTGINGDSVYQYSLLPPAENETEPPSGGGGGGGGGSSNPTVVSKDGNKITVNVTNSSTGITQVQITLNKNATNTAITFASSDSSPPIPTSSQTYQTFEMTFGGGDEISIINVSIYFKINKSWVESNERDPTNVTLFRKTGTENIPIWKILPTTLVSSDSDNYYYMAISPGFSTFSVVVGSIFCDNGQFRCLVNDLQRCDSSQWSTIKSCQNGCSEDKCIGEGNLFSKIPVYYSFIVLILFIMIIVFFIIRRLKNTTNSI